MAFFSARLGSYAKQESRYRRRIWIRTRMDLNEGEGKLTGRPGILVGADR